MAEPLHEAWLARAAKETMTPGHHHREALQAFREHMHLLTTRSMPSPDHCCKRLCHSHYCKFPMSKAKTVTVSTCKEQSAVKVLLVHGLSQSMAIERAWSRVSAHQLFARDAKLPETPSTMQRQKVFNGFAQPTRFKPPRNSAISEIEYITTTQRRLRSSPSKAVEEICANLSSHLPHGTRLSCT